MFLAERYHLFNLRRPVFCLMTVVNVTYKEKYRE